MSDISGGNSFVSEGHEFEFSGIVPGLEQDLAGLDEKPVKKQPAVVINKSKTGGKKELGLDEEPLKVFDAMQTQIKELKAQVSICEKDIKRLTKERDQLQLAVTMADDRIATEKENSNELLAAMEEQLKLNTQHAEERLKQAEAELGRLQSERKTLISELEEAQRKTAEAKLEASDLQLRIEKIRQSGFQHAALEKDLELKTARVIKLSRELDKVLTENAKLVQAVSLIKSKVAAIGEEHERLDIREIKEILSQLDLGSERRQIEAAIVGKPRENSNPEVSTLKAQLDDALKKLSEVSKQLETERVDRLNVERRMKADIADFESRCSRMSIESSQMKERKSQIGIIEKQLDSREKSMRVSLTNTVMTDKIGKHKAAVTMYKRERVQMKRALDSLEAENRELRTELSETRQRLVEAAARNATDEAKLTMIQLKNTIEDQAYCFSVEKSQLNDRVFQLETELEVLERQKNARISDLEQELARLKLDVAKKAGDKSPQPDEKWQKLLAESRLENADTRDQLAQSEAERFKIENLLLSSRSSEKRKDLEASELLAKFKKAQDEIFDLRSHTSLIEAELVKLNEKLGDALNANNDLEEQIISIRKGKRY